jgi:hypothetical protein
MEPKILYYSSLKNLHIEIATLAVLNCCNIIIFSANLVKY